MIDSITARGHSRAAGAKRGTWAQGFRRSCVGLTTKAHARPDGQGRSLGFMLTASEVSDGSAVPALLAMQVGMPHLMLADKGYDGNDVRQSLLLKGVMPVIPSKANRRTPAQRNFRQYQDRNRVARRFNRLKQAGGIATRYNKIAVSFMAFPCLAASCTWMKNYVNTT